MTKYLMNHYTGSVDTEENWKASYECGEFGMHTDFCQHKLIEVEQDENGDWIDVK